jgi:hypothetical protein
MSFRKQPESRFVSAAISPLMHVSSAEREKRLTAAMVSEKRREVMAKGGSLGKVWESVSGNDKENR